MADEVNTTEEEVKVAGIKNSNENNTYSVVSPMQMHGRRQIFTNETVITSANVLKVLNDALKIHARNRSEEMYLEKYLRGIQPILDRVKVYHDEINNKIVVNVANQIVTFKTAEFAGEPIQYISRGSKKSVPKKVEKLNSLMLSEGKQSKDMDLAYKMFTAGVGYRLVLRDKALPVSKGELLDEAPFEIYVPDPRNTFVIRVNDVSKRVIAGVTYVFLDDAKSKVKYTVYTDNVTYEITGSALSVGDITSVTIHNFGMVTLVEYPCNSVYMGAFEVVLPLLDAYNSTMSNRLDGIEQFIQAIMVFEGVDISREEILELKDLGAIKLPPAMDGRQSRVYYLNEQLDQSQTQTLVDDIYHTILQIVGMPSQGNANTSDSSNAISDVEPKFGRRSYEDLLVKTQSFSTLRSAGMPSIQAFTFSKLSKDPESDAMVFDAYQEEREEALNAASTIGGTGGGSSTDYSEETEAEESGDSEDSGSSGSNSYGVCPVCKRRFKRKGNQVYDRDECRRIAQRQKRGGMATL